MTTTGKIELMAPAGSFESLQAALDNGADSIYFGVDGIRKPAISLKDNIIYFFEDGKISTYNVLTKELNEYLIDLFLEASEMYYANDKLYILGGFRKNNYSLYPSKGLFSIDISEFDTTKIHNLKTL